MWSDVICYCGVFGVLKIGFVDRIVKFFDFEIFEFIGFVGFEVSFLFL